MVLSLTFIPLEDSFGLEGSIVVIAPDRWMHLSLDGEPIESMSWLQYGNDIQVTFWAYNQSDVQFDQFVITPNQTFSDPFDKFSVLWKGNFGSLGEIVFIVSSPLGIVTTIVEKFPGEVPRYGKPAMTVKKTVITEEGRLYDVIVDKKHVATFEWSYVTIYSNETGLNQTFPELKVYNSDGSEYDTKVLTATYVPLVDYYDVVGWMVSTMTENYVKWILYSGKPIQVRISQGFTTTPLPFFVIYPKSLEVQSGETVTIRWTLPKGVQSYTTSWNDTYMQRYLDVISEEFDPSTGEYEVQLVFHDNAEGRRFLLEVEAERYGTRYRSGERIKVISPTWKTMALPAIGGLGIITVLVFLLILALRRRRSPPDPYSALQGGLQYAS
jgi:hypothetical protein